jgi:hypothetical protein
MEYRPCLIGGVFCCRAAKSAALHCFGIVGTCKAYDAVCCAIRALFKKMPHRMVVSEEICAT